MVVAVVSGLIGTLTLFCYYRLLQSKWPNNYFTTTQYVDYVVSIGAIRYSLFRLAPPYVVLVVAGATASRYGNDAGWAVLFCGVGHILSTSGWSILANMRAQHMRRGGFVLDVLVGIALALVTLSAYLTYSLWLPLVPTIDKFTEVLLTGVVAAVVVLQLQKLTRRGVDVAEATNRQLATLPKDLINTVNTSAEEFGVDQNLALSVVITEAIQRPAWLRWSERLAGRFHLAETFGVAQATRDWTASDAESVRQAVKSLSGRPFIRGRSGHVSTAILQYHLEQHNRSDEFLEMASDVFRFLESRYPAVSAELAGDGSPALRVSGYVRSGAIWRMTGDCGGEFVIIAGASAGKDRSLVFDDDASGGDTGARWKWSLSIPIEQETAFIAAYDGVSKDECTKAVALTVPLGY